MLLPFPRPKKKIVVTILTEIVRKKDGLDLEILLEMAEIQVCNLCPPYSTCHAS